MTPCVELEMPVVEEHKPIKTGTSEKFMGHTVGLGLRGLKIF